MAEEIIIKNRWNEGVVYKYTPTEVEQKRRMGRRAALENAVRSGANLSNAYLSGTNLRDAYLRGADLRGADLRGANLRDAYLRGANLSDAYLCRADLGGAELDGADLRGANLRGANLSDAYLCGADLLGADLRGANLSNAYLRGANLSNAYLCGADLGGQKLVSERPILQVGPIGSRGDYLIAYVTDGGLYLQAGCFFGSRDEFVKALAKEHGKNIHAKGYEAALQMIEVHERLWREDTGAQG